MLGLNVQPGDQELHAIPTELARLPMQIYFYYFLEILGFILQKCIFKFYIWLYYFLSLCVLISPWTTPLYERNLHL